MTDLPFQVKIDVRVECTGSVPLAKRRQIQDSSWSVFREEQTDSS